MLRRCVGVLNRFLLRAVVQRASRSVKVVHAAAHLLGQCDQRVTLRTHNDHRAQVDWHTLHLLSQHPPSDVQSSD